MLISCGFDNCRNYIIDRTISTIEYLKYNFASFIPIQLVILIIIHKTSIDNFQ